MIGIALLISACAAGPVAEPPALVRANAHSGGSVVAFSPSGDLLASGGWEGTVRLWQVPQGKQVRHWRDHSDSVNGIAFLDGDRQLVTAGYDGRLVMRDLAGNILQQITTPAPVTHMVAGPDKDRVLTGHSDGVVRLWRLADFALLQERAMHRGAVKAVAIDPQSMRYASGGADGRVFVWAEAGEASELEAPPADPWTLAFAPDGQWLSGGSWFRLFRWDLQDGTLTTLPTQHHGIIKSVEYVSGDVLASISRQTDSSVYFLDPASGETLRRFQRHALCGADISVSPDGRYLATTSDDASVRVWVLGSEK
jgi:WD40 repeat protein